VSFDPPISLEISLWLARAETTIAATDERFSVVCLMDNERAATSNDQDYGLRFTDALRESLHPAVIVVNGDRAVTTFNIYAEKLIHLSASKVINQSIDRLPEPLRALINKAFSSGNAEEREEISWNGISLIATAFASGKAPARTIAVVLNDIGPVRALEKSMRQLDRLASVGALSASMAHEVKNAMVAVRTFADALVSENKSADLADIVSREIQRIDGILGQILRVAGPAKPTFAPVHLHALLEQALQLVQHTNGAKDVRFGREFNARPDLVPGDEYQLHQAFLNLFFNAIEAMPLGGELRVKTALLENSRSILVSVSDTGTGIAPEDLPRLFDAFFTTKSQGTGLGLPITRRIIEEHRGTITLESEGMKGATFNVTLPLDTAAKTSPAPNT
jgi:two-component system sensor histidine kinase HydH